MKIIILSIGLLALVSCHSSKKVVENSAVKSTQNNIPKIPVIIATIGDFPKENEPVEIRKAEIKNNILYLSISYSGGCGQHNFELIGSKNITKSLPPTREIQLIHKIENDNCTNIITRNIEVSISNLAYLKENGSEINLLLKGLKDEILYTYQENF